MHLASYESSLCLTFKVLKLTKTRGVCVSVFIVNHNHRNKISF